MFFKYYSSKCARGAKMFGLNQSASHLNFAIEKVGSYYCCQIHKQTIERLVNGLQN